MTNQINPIIGRIYKDNVRQYLIVDVSPTVSLTLENAEGETTEITYSQLRDLELVNANISNSSLKYMRTLLRPFPALNPNLGADGVKDDAGKPQLSIIFEGFPRALLDVARLGEFGAKKYSRGGWQTVPDGINRYTDAMGRHHLGEATDEGSMDTETGLRHATAVAWNALARLELMLREEESRQLES